MAERESTAAGPVALDLGNGKGHESGHLRDRHRDVVLHRRTLGPKRARDRFAQVPEGIGLGLGSGDGRVLDHSGRQGIGQQLLGLALQIRCRIAADQLDQRMPAVRGGKRRARSGNSRQDRLEAILRQHLEPLKRLAQHGPGLEQQLARCSDAGEACPDDNTLRDRRFELQRGRGDNPEGAFRTDEQLLQIEPAIVLLERG